jgi:hypothetical protein
MEPLIPSRKGGGGVPSARKSGGVRPDGKRQIVLRVRAARRNRIPVKAVSGAQDGLRIGGPGNADTLCPIYCAHAEMQHSGIIMAAGVRYWAS